MIVGGHTGLAHDTTHRARVNYEILPEFFRRADTGLGCDTSNVGSPQQAALRMLGFVVSSFALLSLPHYPFNWYEKSCVAFAYCCDRRWFNTIRSVRSAAMPFDGLPYRCAM